MSGSSSRDSSDANVAAVKISMRTSFGREWTVVLGFLAPAAVLALTERRLGMALVGILRWVLVIF